MGVIYEVRRRDNLWRHDVNTTFHAHQLRNSSNIKGSYLKSFRGRSVGLTNVRDICAVEIDAGGMIYTSNFMKIDWGIELMLWLSPQEFERLQFRYF